MKTRKAFSLPVALCLAVAVASADDAFRMGSRVTPKDMVRRNPTTDIAVGFGDVAHISPWRIKRRFPRSGGAKGGQLVTLRDAMLAINESVAKDEEMPEHTFAFGKDGALVSICDIPIRKKSASGEVDEIVVRMNDSEGKPVTPEMLEMPVRDFSKVEFSRMSADGADKAKKKAESKKDENPEIDTDKLATGTERTIKLPGGATMEMIWCGPGTFMMGSPLTETGRFEDELIHPVTLTKGFWLGKYEVTQEQWESVMGENRSRFKAPDRPVDGVSWEDCQGFIRKVNVALGGVARLPTEAEWEYACRAGSVTPVAGSGHLNDMAWYDRNSGSQTHAVGKHQANAWGFYDMHGNVLEWCSDWFSKQEGQAIDPKGPASGAFRVLRGGCWFFYERDCRSAYRLKRDPGIRNCIFGFRLACSGKGK